MTVLLSRKRSSVSEDLASEERLLTVCELDVAGAKLGWHVALASSPSTWDLHAPAKGVLVVVAPGEVEAAVPCIAALRAQARPLVALLVDVPPGGAADVKGVVERQRVLLAAGADDVLGNVSRAAALELVLAMSRTRCVAKKPCPPMVTKRPSGRGSTDDLDFMAALSEIDSLVVSEFSGLSGGRSRPSALEGHQGSEREGVDSLRKLTWNPATPKRPTVAEMGVNTDAAERPAVAEMGVNTDAAIGAASLCCARCSRPPVPTPPRSGSRSGSLVGSSDRRGTRSRSPSRVGIPEAFHGSWVAAFVDGSAVDDVADMNPWLRNLHISAEGVVILGDGKKDHIRGGEDGRFFLCGGELELHGDLLVRIGKSGIAVEFCRELCDVGRHAGGL